MEHNIAATVCGGLVGAVMIVTGGCAQPPTEQLQAASKAIETARAAGATEYAKEDLAKLEQQFALAKAELAKQEKSLSIFHSYTDADNLLKEVATTGRRVEVLAIQNKEAAKAAALAEEKEARQIVASAKELVTNAPTGKERGAVEVMKQDIAGLETSLGEIRQLVEKGDYLSAETHAKAVKDKGSAVSEEIREAIDKTKPKRPKTSA